MQQYGRVAASAALPILQTEAQRRSQGTQELLLELLLEQPPRSHQSGRAYLPVLPVTVLDAEQCDGLGQNHLSRHSAALRQSGFVAVERFWPLGRAPRSPQAALPSAVGWQPSEPLGLESIDELQLLLVRAGLMGVAVIELLPVELAQLEERVLAQEVVREQLAIPGQVRERL
jgi:hypothetical protein